MDRSLIRSSFLALFRSFRSRCGLFLAASATAGLGIGIATATFSLAHELLWNNLPYKSASQLVHISENVPSLAIPLIRIPTFRMFQEHSKTVEQSVVFRVESSTVVGIGHPFRIGVVRVSSEFFRMFGVDPILGRTFLSTDEGNQQDSVVVISQQFWRTTLNAIEPILGLRILLNDEPVTVVGVIPGTFQFPPSPNHFLFDTIPPVAVWRPLGDRFFDYPSIDSQVKNFNHFMLGRLALGATTESAMVELNTIRDRLKSQYPRSYTEGSIDIELLSDRIRRPYEKPMWGFIAAVIGFCLISSLNISTLMVIDALRRRGIFSTMLALGGTKSVIVFQLAIEILSIILVGAVVGLGIASIVLKGITISSPAEFVRLRDIDIGVFPFLTSITVVALGCLALVIVPYTRLLADFGRNVFQVATDYQPRVQNGVGLRSLSFVLMFQILISAVLLNSVAVLARSNWNVVNEDPGFAADSVLTMNVRFPVHTFVQDLEGATAKLDEILLRIQSLPGVDSVGSVDNLPLSGPSNISVTSKYEGRDVDEMSAEYRWVKGSYFSTIGIPLSQGRLLDGFDAIAESKRALINTTFASSAWPNENPIGKRFKRGRSDESRPWYTVVGVVGDVRNSALTEGPMPQVYLNEPYPWMSIVARTVVDPLDLVDPIRSVVSSIDSTLAISDVQTMDQVVMNSTSRLRFCLLLAVCIAAVSTVLAFIGIACSVRYSIGQKRFGAGIRVALGATERQVAWYLLGAVLGLIAVALVGGGVCSKLSSVVLSGLLYQVDSWDVLSFACVSALLMTGGLLTCWAMIRRIIRADPLELLKS